ncbi:MAG: hydroxymethylglutaryl-CoA reductase (NADPH) [Candidatus Methanomethylophilus sp.]|jgi:hydroxymethylglutaryl-CoA reductase (NADPH)|nr:hydroxymethylglutaryl-CoA reductase (NADPH) [Methanomethylophilus sp.]MCI2074229.1 hydroxymethylglutaryl-CoA reductase (NADPH) [Methanomethylophilus sp.]MCI2092974.1 hydroxymethylglutaryl-CoA reductase (NADPH) [Methanomethylophilus sp.]MEE3400828.1 hydroxymethylglutaryl-CoA reductase (NADPH) [Methanomethylophilus sp.]WII09418.1 hydroxymethylglutaryl-CoA reductase (NADPH) [Methanomassiliicoccales archaeon LGM-DZ1]
MTDGTGLKNRGHTHADVDERRGAVEQFTGADLEKISKYCFRAEDAEHNIENMIGAVQVPLGFAGPLKVEGEYAEGEFLVPLATTEGALVASISRGMSVITAAGGARTKVFSDCMTRAPVLRVDGLSHACRVIQWIDAHEDDIKAAAASTTKHGRLVRIEKFPTGRALYLRFSFETGDAMGMNMATIASEAACRVIEEATGAVMVSVSGNLCSDKKPAAVNMIEGRGKTVVAEALIPKDLVESKLHTTTALIVETNVRKNFVGSSLAGTLGANAHAANMVAAFYIATGQDPAQVVGGSMTLTDCEDVGGDLYISVRMPAVELGTVGGGTGLPCQREALEMMGCKGEGKARKLAEILAGTVLAGELSTLAAQAAGQLGRAHAQLGRNKA